MGLKKNLMEIKKHYLLIMEILEDINKININSNIKEVCVKQYSTNDWWFVFKCWTNGDIYDVKEWVFENNIAKRVMLTRNEVAFPVKYFEIEGDEIE